MSLRPFTSFALRSVVAVALLGALPVVGCGASAGSDEDLNSLQGNVDTTNIDMADYFFSSCDKAGPGWQVGSESFRAVPMGMKDGMGRFVIVKSSDGNGFEEWFIDKDWLRIRTDTTWAYEREPGGPWCDVKCGDNGAGNCQQRWNTNASDPLNGLSPSSPWALTIYHEVGKPSVAAPFVARKMTLPMGGEYKFAAKMEIKVADRSACSECSVNFATKPGQSVSRTVTARRYATFQGFQDVVHLHVDSGPGAGENYYYARGKGWIGFGSTIAKQPSANAAFPQSSCAGFNEGSICEAVGKAGSTPPVSDPPSTPPSDPPPSGGSCACSASVDNFCLYAANTPNCAMTAKGGYCDPNGDGNFDDANWEKGYYDYKDACGASSPPPPPPPPAGACPCGVGGVDNFCLYPANTSGCDMTKPGGYCDPNGDGSFSDANWEKGYYDYLDLCK